MADPVVLQLRKELRALRREVEALKRQVARKEVRPAWGGGGGGGAEVEYGEAGDVVHLEGTTKEAGASAKVARADHQHALPTTLSGKPEGTLAISSGKLIGKLGGSDVNISHFS